MLSNGSVLGRVLCLISESPAGGAPAILLLLVIATGLAAACVVLAACLHRKKKQLRRAADSLGKAERNQQSASSALQESEAKYRSLVESSPISVLIIRDGAVLSANRAAAQSVGLERADDLVGRDLTDFIEPAMRDEAREKMQAPPGDGSPIATHYTLAMRRVDGSIFRAEQHASVVRFQGERAVQICSLDLTQCDEAERELFESQERLRLAMDATDDGIWDRDLVSGETYFSPRWFTMLGYEPDALPKTHETWLELLHPADRAHSERAVDDLVAGKTDSMETEFRLRTESGEWKWVLSRAKATVRDKNGRALRLVGTHVDITERRRLETERQRLRARILHAQKLEGLGVLAGGVAHDFNNLLTGVLGNTSLALEDLPDDSPVRTDLEEVMATARQAAGLCRQLLAYSGKGAFMVEPVDFSILIEETAYLLAVSISKKAELSYNLDYDLPSVEIDPAQARQIILNLVTNASEAVGDKRGQIRIATGKKVYTREELSATYLKDDREPGQYVYLEISDTGDGMDEETRVRIFDPFFTTKVRGRGLGLAAVLGIVRAHAGAISIESAPGRGSTFRLLFPAADKPAKTQREFSLSPAAGQSRGTILVVDDEGAVRRTAQRMLERAGFDVITANNGLEAVETVRAGDHAIQAVLLDLTMPVMGGAEALGTLRELRPDMKIVLSSGYDKSGPRERASYGDYEAFIKKPYSPGELIAVMRSVLADD